MRKHLNQAIQALFHGREISWINDQAEANLLFLVKSDHIQTNKVFICIQ